MAGNYRRRKRTVDVNDMTVEQIDALSLELGNEVAKIMDEANKKCNKLLSIYGMETKIGYELLPLEKPVKKKSQPKKKVAK